MTRNTLPKLTAMVAASSSIFRRHEMKSIYSMLAIVLMIIGLLVSINSFGQQAPVSGDGPTYNFNFYNKDSIPSGQLKIDKDGKPIPIATPTSPQSENPKVEERKVEAEEEMINSFGLFYSYQQTYLGTAKDSNGRGNLKLSYGVHGVGIKNTFEKRFTLGVKYLFGKVTEAFSNQPYSDPRNYIQDQHSKTRGVGINFEYTLLSSKRVLLDLGFDYTLLKSNLAPVYISRSYLIPSHDLTINTLLATLTPKFALTRNIHLNISGGYGRSWTNDIDSKKFNTAAYGYGASLAFNF